MIRVLSEWNLHRGLLSQVCSLLHQGLLGKRGGKGVEGGEQKGGHMWGEKVMDIVIRFF
jgi:hypothetical protein